MTTFDTTLSYLYSLQDRGIKFGLRNIRTLLSASDNPERRFQSFHIAGTNGKGSTSSFLSSILQEGGFTTGLYTSPHLVSFTERIRINGKCIPESMICEYVERLKPVIEKTGATFFEATTCIAFQYFADRGVDIAVVETGLGGRLDATNVLRPLASVITSISFDHMEYLGNTLGKIAKEKGGIMKPRVPCVTSVRDPEILRTLRMIADRKNARLWCTTSLVTDSPCGAGMRFTTRTLRTRCIQPGLPGEHQVANAMTAVGGIEVVVRSNETLKRSLTGTCVSRGIERVKKNTGIRGRCERRGRGGKYIFDVAHNPDGIRVLLAYLRGLGGRFVIVMGMMADKQYSEMIQEIGHVASNVVLVRPGTPRAATVDELHRECHARGIPAIRGGTVKNGMKIAGRMAVRGRRVVVTGSHYVVGEALQWWDSEKTLTKGDV